MENKSLKSNFASATEQWAPYETLTLRSGV